MPWRIIYGLVALFVLTNAQGNSNNRRLVDWKETPSDHLIDIDLETEGNNVFDQGWQGLSDTSGSGSSMDTDDEDLAASGSGSGAGSPHFTDTSVDRVTQPTTFTPAPTTPPSTTLSFRSPCEQLREASKHLLGNYVPQCRSDGTYASRQCRGHPGTGTCWCADLSGGEIPGTALSPPHVPDCKNGSNLPPCVFKLLRQSRTGLLGAFRPKCTFEGNFEMRQCSGSTCYCVDTTSGVEIPDTRVLMPDVPDCEGQWNRPTKAPRVTTKAPVTLFPEWRTTQGPKKDRPTTMVDINLGDTEDEDSEEVDVDMDKDKDKGKDKGKDKDLPNQTGDADSDPMLQRSSAAHIMTQPGILAAIIGGSVVLLLCAILLVMFIVYRMRKKDEGSYALDEPKKMPNYSYQRAPVKEFYA